MREIKRYEDLTWSLRKALKPFGRRGYRILTEAAWHMSLNELPLDRRMELLTGVGCSPELCEFLIEQGRHSRPADLREKSVLEELEKLEKLGPGKLAMAKPLLVSTSYLLLFSTPMVWLLIGPTAAHKIAAGYFVIPLAITLYFWWANFRDLREGLQDERDRHGKNEEPVESIPCMEQSVSQEEEEEEEDPTEVYG